MNSGHQTFNNSKLLVNGLGQWCKTIGGTRCVGDDILVQNFDERKIGTKEVDIWVLTCPAKVPSFTPITNMGASAEGAEMMTRFAPPLR